MSRKASDIVLLIVIIAIVIALDRWSKYWIVTNIRLEDGFTVIKNFFNIVYVRNFGGAFSILQHRKELFIITGTLVPLIIILFLRNRMFENKICLLSCAMIIGGALGNLYDRIVYGYVIDFLQFGRFPVFNIADSCITVGVFILAIVLIKDDMKQNKKIENQESVESENA